MNVYLVADPDEADAAIAYVTSGDETAVEVASAGEADLLGYEVDLALADWTLEGSGADPVVGGRVTENDVQRVTEDDVERVIE